MEAIAPKSDLITVVKDLPPPTLVVMSVSLKTVPNPKTHLNEASPHATVADSVGLVGFITSNDVAYHLFQIVSLAALIHYEFPLDKAPPKVPYQTHFCGKCPVP